MKMIAGTSAQHQLFQERDFFEKANYLEKQYSALPALPG